MLRGVEGEEGVLRGAVRGEEDVEGVLRAAVRGVEDDGGVLRGVLFLGGVLRGVGFLAAVAPDGGGFAVLPRAAFQDVPHAMHDRSVRALLVSHAVQRQGVGGRPAPPGRLAAGRAAPPPDPGFFATGFAPGSGFTPGFGPDLGGSGAVSRRVPPQVAQDASVGSLNVSQSAQRQLADAATSC